MLKCPAPPVNDLLTSRLVRKPMTGGQRTSVEALPPSSRFGRKERNENPPHQPALPDADLQPGRGASGSARPPGGGRPPAGRRPSGETARRRMPPFDCAS